MHAHRAVVFAGEKDNRHQDARHLLRKLRTYMHLRDKLVVERTQAINHMQKALFKMNVQLSNLLSDITGESGLRIIEAILAGERDSEQLAALCSPGSKPHGKRFQKLTRQLG